MELMASPFRLSSSTTVGSSQDAIHPSRKPVPEVPNLWAQMGDAVVAFPDFDPVRPFQ